jgi:aryl sulfotransferase
MKGADSHRTLPGTPSFAVVERYGLQEIGDFDRVFIGGADTFLYKGTNGRWRDLLTTDEVAIFDEESTRRLPPEANRWANRQLEAN